MRNAVNSFIAILVLLAAMITPVAQADLISLTGAETAPNIAEITVLDDRIRVMLELSLDDLGTFKALLPDRWLGKEGLPRASLADRLSQFSTETFSITAGEDGTPLQAKLRTLEPRLRKDRYSAFAGKINPMTGRRVPGPPEDKRIIFVELEYPFSDKPEGIVIVPPQDKDGKPVVSIGFIAYHKTVPIIDFRYLSVPAKLALDWDDPWYTKFENPNLKRHHKSPVMTYLYMEPREVRHEILFRVRDLLEWTDLGLGDETMIDTAVQSKVRERAQSFFAGRDLVEIDGMQVRPATSRAVFLIASAKGVQSLEDSKLIDQSTALIGIILSYPVEHLPQGVTVRWDLFNERVKQVPATAIDPAGPLLSLLEPGVPDLEWQNFLKKYSEPVIQAVTVDTGWSLNIPYIGETKILNQIPDQDQSLSIVEGVLENVRIAFIEKEPGNFSRVLGGIVRTNVPDVLQKELGKLFSPKVTGGAVGAVQVINDMQIVTIRELNESDGFSATISGAANIKAQHWGHVDQRQIEFQALLDLVEEDKQWKLADLTVIDLKELK